MRKVLRLARREYIAAVHTKGFIIGLLIAPIFMSGSFIFMAIFKDKVDTQDKVIAVVDRSGVVAEALVEAADRRNAEELVDEEGRKVKPAYVVRTLEPAEDLGAQRLELSDQVRSGDLHAFIEIGPSVLHPRASPESSYINYHTKNPIMDDARRWVPWPVNQRLRSLRLAEAGIDESQVEDVFDWISASGMGLISRDAETGSITEAEETSELQVLGIPFAMLMFMFLLLMMGATPLISAVMEEKTQRIAEVLLGSVTPSQLMAGKVLGGLGVSLTASALYVSLAFVGLSRMGSGDIFPQHLLPWFFSYLVVGVVLYGSFMAALGAACNDAKEAQSATPLAMFPILLPLFAVLPIIQQPLGAFATTLSLIPLFTPTVMLLRQSTPETIPMWQPYVGLAGTLLFTLFVVWAGGRIFRVGILMHGQPFSLRHLITWIFKG
jgi:ABC-2 type transport system permease protein